jgi:hypothetical protein
MTLLAGARAVRPLARSLDPLPGESLVSCAGSSLKKSPE